MRNASLQDKIQSQTEHSKLKQCSRDTKLSALQTLSIRFLLSILWTQSQKNSGDGSRLRTLYNHTLQQSLRSPTPAYAELSRPSLVSTDSSTNVSFKNTEHGGHYSQFDVPRQRSMPSICQAHLPYAGDLEIPELSDVSKVGHEKSSARTLITLSLAIVRGPFEAMSLSLNRRGMPEWAWCRRVRLWRVSLN